MSFGASNSLRFGSSLQNEREGGIWEMGSERKSNKKFGYKKKEMKYPLRKTARPEETQEVQKNKENKNRSKPKQDFIKKNRERLMRTKDGIARENGGYYTLTHEQLNSILKSVGKIASLRGEGVNIAIEQALALEKQKTDPLTNELKIDQSNEEEGQRTTHDDEDKADTERTAENKGEEEGIMGLVKGDKSAEGGKDTEMSHSPRENRKKSDRKNRKETDGQLTDRSETRKRKEKRTPRIDSPKGDEKNVHDPGLKDSERVEEKSDPRFAPPPIPKSHMTKAERKRLEMQKDGDHVEVRIESEPSPRAEKPGSRRTRNPLTNSAEEDVPPIKFHIPPPIPKAHLTLAEKKRLQWEIERGEAINTPPSKKTDSTEKEEKTQGVDDNRSRGVGNETGDKVDNSENHVSEETTSPRVMPVPKAHLTQAERKRVQWESERAELERQRAYDPWGRPGAGAPIQTNTGKPLTDYRTRKEEAVRESLEVPKDSGLTTSPRPQNLPPQSSLVTSPRMAPIHDQTSLPAAMRSSFALGYIAPNDERFKNTKEEERRKWLEDLEKQKEEQRLKKIAEKEKDRQYFQETWAEKLSYDQHIPAPLPDQTAVLSPRGDQTTLTHTDPSPRVNSAPQATTEALGSKSYLRGQGSLMDPTTKRELDDKKRRNLEHQAAVMAQVEEKQTIKRLERERKIQEELEEERKLQQERDFLQRQYDLEQQKSRLKEEARQHRLQELKEAMDQASYHAQQDKYSKRMQHLQQGGHDIKRLQANLEANLTPRPTVRYVEPAHVPGLDLTPRQIPSDSSHHAQTVQAMELPQRDAVAAKYHHVPYTENRVLTPSMFRRNGQQLVDVQSPHREFGTQTETELLNEILGRQDTDTSIMYKEAKPQRKKVRVKSASKDKESGKQNKKPPAWKKGPLNVNERPKWGSQNPKQIKPTKQSEKDPFFERKKREREERRARREQELLALVEANKRVIPRDKFVASEPEDDFHDDVDSGLLYEDEGNGSSSHRSNHAERTRPYNRSLSPPITTQQREGKSRGRSRSRSPSYGTNIGGESRATNAHSPPVPALRHKLDVWREPPQNFDNDYELDSHSYRNYHPSRQGHGKKLTNDHYEDEFDVDIPTESNDFVPFTRTSEILDPRKAGVPVVVSRENSSVARARQEYHRGQRPGAHGNQLEYFDDKKYQIVSPTLKDPILNPNVVRGHPTPRQDLILQQLSDLKLNLMQRQREIETCMSPSTLQILQDETH